MAFNKFDKKNPNVQAIASRAPMREMEYSFRDVISSMYEVAKGDGGGLFEWEKMIVTREIESFADPTMDISLRTQAQAFRVYNNMKRRYGEGNTEWIDEVHAICGKRAMSQVAKAVEKLIGNTGTVKRPELVKYLAATYGFNVRTAQRRIKEAVELEQVYQNKQKGGDISLQPFTKP